MRFSATTLEAFRLWRDCSFMSEAELVAQIRGAFVPTHPVLLGKAYGRILEKPDQHRVPDGYACDGYRFEAAAVEPALARIDRRGAIFENKATKRYGPHTVVSKADYVLGLRVREFKTTLGRYIAEKYSESYQWRFMLDMFGATEVVYHVHQLSEAPLALDAIDLLPLSGYAELHDDCAQLLDEAVSFVVRRGLEACLPDVHDPFEGPVFEDGPIRKSPSKRLRALRDEPLPIKPTVLPALAPIAELPLPLFTLRAQSAAGGSFYQPSLF